MSSGEMPGLLAVTVPSFATLVGDPQTFVCPAPPHVIGGEHEPQSMLTAAPQLLKALTVPQFFPMRRQRALPPLEPALPPRSPAPPFPACPLDPPAPGSPPAPLPVAPAPPGPVPAVPPVTVGPPSPFDAACPEMSV
jgi:hypothetical protein